MFVTLTIGYDACRHTQMMQKAIYKAVGARIAARRRHLGMTQETVAARLGMSRASLANIETGRQSLLLHNVYAIAEVLELSLVDLLPASSKQPVTTEQDDVEIPDDLKSEQRKQIAMLVASVTVSGQGGKTKP